MIITQDTPSEYSTPCKPHVLRTLAYRLGQCLTYLGGMVLLALIAELLVVVPGSLAPWAGLALWRIAVGALATTGAGIALWLGCGPEPEAEYGQ